jgi:hypothetical protein
VSYDPAQVAFIDTETAGLDPEHHAIWEIAVIVDDVEHCWQQRLPIHGVGGVPGSYFNTVDQWVLDNTGIRDRYDHDTALEPMESIARFVELVRGRHLVGACPWFDSERLHRLWLTVAPDDKRALPWHYHLIDVENLAIGWLAGFHEAGWHEGFRQLEEAGLPWKSTDLSIALNVNPADFEPKHSALADARWAKAMYEAVIGTP